MERKGEGGLPKNVGCRATTREMGVDWQGGEGRGRSEACQTECWIDFFLLKSRVGVGIAGWVQNGYGCEGKSDGRDRGRGVGRGNSKNQGLLSVVVNISNEHDWDVYCLWKKLSLKPLKRSPDLFSPADSELPPPDPESLPSVLDATLTKMS
ncbi:hypothetical protein ACFX2J_005470 [Malus domestica]